MKKYFGPLFLLVIFSPFLLTVRAQESDINQKINEYQQKITELQGQEDSLSKEINLLNSRIALTTLKISSTRSAINKLSAEIDELTSQIDELEQLKTKRLLLVLHRAPESYRRGVTPLFGMLFFSQNFWDFIQRVKYLETVQEQDVHLYRQFQLTQNNYNERKDTREKKKQDQEMLKRQLEKETQELAGLKQDKQLTLEQTKNSEAVYQRLLASALAEKQAIEAALISGVAVGPVKRGDPIALVGNTGYPGCSTGPHLHFEIRKNNAWVDPAGYLSSKTVIDEQNNDTNWTTGNGPWAWPVADAVRLTQHFGQTPYSWVYKYSGGIHTGYDMVSTTSEVIRAPADGMLYTSSQNCGGSIIKIKYIDHGDGVLSFYLHVQ